MGQNYLSMRTKLVHNMSSYELSEVEERVLARGWEFCIEKKLSDSIELKTEIEINANRLGEITPQNQFRTMCLGIRAISTTLIKHLKNKKFRNISKEELLALRQLRENKNIVICRADKGNSIVILERVDYISKAEDILRNKQFKVVNNSALEENEKRMNNYILNLQKTKSIDRKTYWRVHSTSASLAVMYGLPKLHKSNYPLRPIISSIGSYNHGLAKYLCEIIKDNIEEKSYSYIKDSFEFANKITEIKAVSNQTMLRFDVDNLLTNVPVQETIEIVLNTIYKKN